MKYRVGAQVYILLQQGKVIACISTEILSNKLAATSIFLEILLMITIDDCSRVIIFDKDKFQSLRPIIHRFIDTHYSKSPAAVQMTMLDIRRSTTI